MTDDELHAWIWSAPYEDLVRFAENRARFYREQEQGILLMAPHPYMEEE